MTDKKVKAKKEDEPTPEPVEEVVTEPEVASEPETNDNDTPEPEEAPTEDENAPEDKTGGDSEEELSNNE